MNELLDLSQSIVLVCGSFTHDVDNVDHVLHPLSVFVTLDLAQDLANINFLFGLDVLDVTTCYLLLNELHLPLSHLLHLPLRRNLNDLLELLVFALFRESFKERLPLIVPSVLIHLTLLVRVEEAAEFCLNLHHLVKWVVKLRVVADYTFPLYHIGRGWSKSRLLQLYFLAHSLFCLI